MPWFYWFLIALWVVNALCYTALIGRKRDPYTAIGATINWVIVLAFCYGVLATEGVV